jgi:hypothetical protein
VLEPSQAQQAQHACKTLSSSTLYKGQGREF